MIDESLMALMTSAALFCATMTITPGPNNVLLATSGANYGVKKTVPHVVGIRIGSSSLHLAMLLGLGALFQQWPQLHTGLKYLSLIYLLYLALKIARLPTSDEIRDQDAKPMTLSEAALFQWINPKSWMATITLCSAFTLAGDAYWLSAVAGVMVFNMVGFPASFTWVFLGAGIRHKLSSPKRRARFNYLMSGLLLVCIPMMIH
ncbi:LysE family translocator [Shewanella colwelliana]|uniref:LysE family translocator n=1 Tax=Shewanella colwelliana TaxID=23 RepID=UPI0022AF4F3D|nr:LysE family transporter [Shewanella colwelliana]MCZ4336433.1 LysE family transporter [Shewanella colwelliana]